MDNLLESIRAAVAADASPEARAAGASACRTFLTALEGTVGQPLGAIVATPPMVPPIADIVAALRGVPSDQLLDLAISKMRAALPTGTDVPKVRPLDFRLITVPRPGGGS